MGIYSGSYRDVEADYLFSTVQTISKQEHLDMFGYDHFDYIVMMKHIVLVQPLIFALWISSNLNLCWE